MERNLARRLDYYLTTPPEEGTVSLPRRPVSPHKPPMEKEVMCRYCGHIWTEWMQYICGGSWALWYFYDMKAHRPESAMECPGCGHRLFSYTTDITYAVSWDGKLTEAQKEMTLRRQ